MERIISIDVGLRNLAYVQASVPNTVDQVQDMSIERWEVVDLLTGSKVKQVAFSTMTDRVLEFLQETFGDATADIVLIENQPCRMNPRLKSVQMVIYTYFKTMHLHTSAFPDIRLVHASKRLRHVPQTHTETQTYAQRKKGAVLACDHYLRHVLPPSQHAQMFLEIDRKRDDLADCLLQAIVFIERRASRSP